jgi:hypothetical protein
MALSWTLMQTRSPAQSARTMATKASSAAGTRPGHVSALWGQESHVAAWGSHSAGQRNPSPAGAPETVVAPGSLAVTKAPRQIGVGVDSPVAQEWPFLPNAFDR